MEYFKILNLTREPFSGSPDPDFFHESPQYMDCLQQLEIALRLRRGLNIVTGDTGTGKTTLCLQLIRRLSWDKGLVIHLLSAPDADTPEAFLLRIAGLLGSPPVEDGDLSQGCLKEAVKNHLLQKSLEEGKIVVLAIDEGQSLPAFALEILREFLNYETNGCKLLQIVIFARRELLKTLRAHRGFSDRINLLFHLRPLSFGDTKSMILFRIKQAAENGATPIRFTLPALWEIHRAAGGVPGNIVTVCHRVLLMLIVQTRDEVDRSLVLETLRRSGALRSGAGYAVAAGAIAGLLLVFFLLQLGTSPGRDGKYSSRTASLGGRTAATGDAVFPIRANSGRAAKPNPPGDLEEHQSALRTAERKAALPPTVPAKAVDSPAAAEPVRYDPAPGAPAVMDTPASPSFPATLGRLTVGRGDVVWRLLADIYGISNSKYLRIFEEANPQIRDIDRIALGEVVHFPAIPTSLAPRPRLCWMALAESGDLEEIFRLYRLYPRALPGVRIVSWWNRSGGLRFALVLRKSFDGEKAAWQAVDIIPERISVSARILSHWEEGTVFFSAFEAS
jgi:general secretion pathway protein A